MFDRFNRPEWARPTKRKLRISPLAWSHQVVRTLQGLGNSSPSSESASEMMVVDASEYLRLLKDMSTNLWRLRQKMLQPGTDEPMQEMRRAYRSFEAAWDTLLEAGVEVQDHTGSAFHSGLFLHVLAFQATSGLNEETVLETIRPTVYYKQQLIQPGEVIVGTPASASSPETDSQPIDE